MQTLPVEHLVGSTVGNYRIEKLLGSGKSTSVSIGREQGNDREVMITEFLVPERFSAQQRERFIGRFLQEAASIARLQHPQVLPVYAYGVEDDRPYLVTPFAKESSLASIVKAQPRFAPEHTLELLKLIATGLEYVHSQGVVHGSFSPATVLLGEQRTVVIAGFGFIRMLSLRGIEELHHPYAHLVNVAGTFLGIPEYIAPECVQGQIADARADVYALGILLFQLLSGTLPFTGSNPLEVALQHVEQPLPSLHTLAPDVPPALDLVIQQALERDPKRRFQSAGEVARAFECVLRVLKSATIAKVPPKAKKTEGIEKVEQAFDAQVTQPTTVNWLSEEKRFAEKGDTGSTAATGLLPVVPASLASASTRGATGETGTWQLRPPVMTSKLAAVSASGIVATPLANGSFAQGDTVDVVDPFAWWSTQVQSPVAGTFARRPTPKARTQQRPPLKERRQVVALLATGGAIAVGALGLGGVGLVNLLHQKTVSSTAAMQSGTTATTQQAGPTPTVQTTPSGVHATSTPQTKPTTAPTAKPTPKPTQGTHPTPTSGPQPTPTSGPQPTPTPTQPPTPTPTPPPQHTGTVIGHTSQGNNTAQYFTNPADGNGSFLIHLPNGNFVAFERSCTHAGVPVNYDGGQQKLVCPAHGAVFDPANGGNLISGPGNGPLRNVPIRVNADGTITTG